MWNVQTGRISLLRHSKRKSEHTCKQRCLLMPMVLEVGSENSIVVVALPGFFQLHIIRRFMRLAVIFSRQLSSTHTGEQRGDMPVWINPSKKSEGGREKDVCLGQNLWHCRMLTEAQYAHYVRNTINLYSYLRPQTALAVLMGVKRHNLNEWKLK